MAKIIKPGEACKCNCCGCEFEIESHDARMGYADDYSFTSLIMGSVPCRYVLCPQCGSRKIIEWL